MKNEFAPTYNRLLGEHWVLWYSKSNNYSVVDSDFKTILDTYLTSSSVTDFSSELDLTEKESNPIIANITSYLKDCNEISEPSEKVKLEFNSSHRKILKQYVINNKQLQIYFDSDLVKKTIHPALTHLEVDLDNTNAETIFDIYLDDEKLHLFENKKLITSIPKQDYHLLQGKFIMRLLCTIHNNQEKDWISTFHGSTISNRKTSILVVGKSGSGKSTLCTLLASNGFELVADDVSPMLSKDSNIYYNPYAISIKEGAFDKLQSVIDDFKDLPSTIFNKSKGVLKYVPFSKPIKNNYPCKAIIMVNYLEDSETLLEPISIKPLLETLIPDSWLSPNPKHAEQFLDWLQSVKLYKLTYSNTRSVITEISNLFKELNVN